MHSLMFYICNFTFSEKNKPHMQCLSKKTGMQTTEGEYFLLCNPGFKRTKRVPQDHRHWTENSLKSLF